MTRRVTPIAAELRTYITVLEAAQELGVNEGTVLAWIRSGELRAVNVSCRQNGRRPTWRISRERLQEFLRRREVGPPVVKTRRPRYDGSYTRFFPE
jgi:excisionase family DNA binding protein